jgi:uncharacterized protein (TIGR02266 family)
MTGDVYAWDDEADEADDDISVVRLKSRPAGAERRSSRRLPIELDVTIEGGACRFSTTTADLSPGGMFLATHENIPIGTEVVLSFTLPNGTALEIIGIVEWRRGSFAAAAHGMGVSFFCLDPEVKKVLERFCSVREPLYYEDDSA